MVSVRQCLRAPPLPIGKGGAKVLIDDHLPLGEILQLISFKNPLEDYG